MAKYPSNSSVTIDCVKINTFSTLAGISSVADGSGMPMMGSMAPTLEFSADIHDQKAVPFASVRKLFDLCNLPTKDKIKDVKIEFWTDENRTDVILSLTFRGWLSSWTVTSGGGSNHILSFSLQPELNQNHYADIKIGN